MGLEECKAKCRDYCCPPQPYESNLTHNPIFNTNISTEIQRNHSKVSNRNIFNFIENDNIIDNKKEEELEKRKDDIEEKERLDKLKKEILEKQKADRKQTPTIIKINDNINKKDKLIEVNKKQKIKNEKINQLLEDMCAYGSITRDEIKKEKKENPQKFIETSEALKSEQNDQNLFALGLLSDNLQQLGIETAIEKNEGNEDDQDASTTCLQFIVNGYAQKKKYDLHFELGSERNEQLLQDENEYEKFKNDIKKKLSKDYGISEDKIVVTFPQRGSFRIQVIFQSDEFNELTTKELEQKFKNDKEFPELSRLKEIHEDVIMGGCKLSKNQLDPAGNRSEGWAEGEMRGNKPYNPPLGWTGIGLKVSNKYESDEWLGCNNSINEWCVAYHGVGRYQDSENVKHITGIIYKGGFKKGSGQVHKECDDIFHPGYKVDEGVYCTPNVETAAEYSGISEINGVKYQTVLMVRVKPDAIRQCKCFNDYWVVNGTTDEIRPYRILYKKCD